MANRIEVRGVTKPDRWEADVFWGSPGTPRHVCRVQLKLGRADEGVLVAINGEMVASVWGSEPHEVVHLGT